MAGKQIMTDPGTRPVGSSRLPHAEGHHCAACRASETDAELLRALGRLPVPEPGEGFEARLLARVLNVPRARSTPSIPLLRWPVAVAAVLSLGIAVAVSTLTDWRSPEEQVLAGGRSPELFARPVHIQLDSPRELPGATIRLRLPANTILQGYRERRVIEWQADITAGGNRLSLPLLVPGDASGTILIEVEHGGARKTLRLPLPSAPLNSSAENITKT